MTQAAAADGGRRITLTLSLCFLAVMCEGFDIQGMGLAAPRMGPALGIGRDQLGPLFSASIVGLLIGAVVFGRIADWYGRKRVLVGCLAIFGVFSVVTALVGRYDALLAVRLLTGLGLGGALPNLLALCAEAVSPERRTKLVTRITCGMPFGGAAAGLVAASLDWRALFDVGGITPLILAPAIWLALPESHDFLASRAAPMTTVGRRDFLWILFGGGRASATLLLWTASFASLLSLYVLLNWLPTLLGDKGLAKPAASLVALLFNLGAGVGILILADLLERARRRWIIGLWYAGLVGSLVGLALVGPGFAGAGLAGFAAGFFVSSVPLPLYGLAPGYYDVLIRGTGVGASVAVGRLGAIFGPLLAAALLAQGIGATGIMLALLPIAVVAGGATVVLIGRPALTD
jgi:MFS transporter, AAHS family, 3-hydroxyphenylpropionic acid transporter